MLRTEEWIDPALDKIRDKMEWVSEKNKDKIPYRTNGDGCYDDKSDSSVQWRVDDGISWWTNGFWGGIQWLMYQDTGRARYAEIARSSEQKLQRSLGDFYGLHHDVGFMFMPTAVADWRLTGNTESRKTALHAATLLAGRFNPAGGFIRAWNDNLDSDTRGWSIIDSMINLSLLYWAGEESKDPRFWQIAMRHADTVAANFVRPDGSVCHIVEFDPVTGKKLCEYGGQGYAEGSSWTRGQGWALYGFMISYIHTGKEKYLATAKRVADYVLPHIPESGLIPVDFCQPELPAWEDSSGACIIAGGLLELARCLPGKEGEKYRNAALKILKTITDSRADFGETCDAIVQNCSGSYHGSEHNMTMNYADFYYIEALQKVKGTGVFLW